MGDLEEIEESLEIDPEEVKNRIIDFIRENIENAEAEGAVIGLSGGLDSTVTAFLCAEALEKEDVLAISMPEEGVTDSENAEDARDVSEELGIKFREIEISPILEEIKKKVDSKGKNKVAEANLKPRTRMIILYYYANLFDYLVVGASNRSELRCGYFTKHGDGASDLSPIGSLYKTQVREIGERLGVPKDIIEKVPSAGLWENQKDREELGLSYDKIDRIYAGLDIGLEPKEIAEAVGIEKSKVQEFKLREEDSKHKLQRSPFPKF